MMRSEQTATSSTYLGLLRDNRNFRRLWLASLISLGGDWFNTVALLGLVLDLTGSGFYAGAVLAANMLPQFLLSPIAGPAADRFNRKMIMVSADVVRIFLALGMLMVRSRETVWIGIACIAGIASMEAFFQPATGAALPNLVTRAYLAKANVLAGATWGTMLAVGAALGGLVAGLLGRQAAFLINASTFAVSAALVLSIKAKFSAERQVEHQHPIRDVLDGLRFAKSDRRLLALLATKGGFGLGVGVVALLAPFARERFGSADISIGILFAARGLGVVAGPPIAARLSGEKVSRIFAAIGLSMGLYGLAYMTLPLAGPIIVAALIVTVAHLGGGAQWVLSSYGLQRLTPDYIRGRILSFDLALVSLTVALSSLGAGKLTEVIPPSRALLLFATITLVYSVVWSLATRKVWGLEDAPTPPSLS